MNSTTPGTTLAFIGGGNMASAILGGLLRQGMTPDQLMVVEPDDACRERLHSQWGLQALPQPGPALERAGLVVWAVKPQVFREAALPASRFVPQALHLSVAAGIRCESIARWVGSRRIVRCMPNTPALVGRGMTGLYADPSVQAQDRQWAEQVIGTTGQSLWVAQEALLDAVTALSGSGPAYVFYFLEAMTEAGRQMGLSADQAYRLAVATFEGASALAASAAEPPEVLRARVTSKGGTTHAAISAMEASGMKPAFVQAMQAAFVRAAELGDAFGADQGSHP
jgi:pyrroline-5-carboxylate reductase